MRNYTNNYRSLLKEAYVTKKGRNPSYSLRAFARDIGLEPSHLSHIYSGKKNLSFVKALEVANRLGLDEMQTELFVLQVQLDSAKLPLHRETLLKKISELTRNPMAVDLSVELFRLISDWYHIPIIEMTDLAGFEFTAKNIAPRLGLSVQEVELAIERLERLEFIEKKPDGRYVRVHNDFLFKSDKPNPAFRHFHKQMIQKALAAIDTQEPKERYLGADTYPIDPSQIDEATKIIERARRELRDLFQKGKKKTEAYQLTVQLFNLTKTSTKGEKKK